MDILTDIVKVTAKQQFHCRPIFGLMEPKKRAHSYDSLQNVDFQSKHCQKTILGLVYFRRGEQCLNTKTCF